MYGSYSDFARFRAEVEHGRMGSAEGGLIAFREADYGYRYAQPSCKSVAAPLIQCAHCCCPSIAPCLARQGRGELLLKNLYGRNKGSGSFC